MRPIPNKPIPHGTIGAYTNYRCRCDECRSAWRERNRAFVATNREAERARQARHYAANRESIDARSAAWGRSNPDRRREISRSFNRRNRDRRNEESRRYSALNRSAYAAASSRRRARVAAADVRVVTDRDWRRLCSRWDHRCAYCGIRAVLTRDHVVPIARGGRHSIGNLLPACQPCNSQKNRRLLIEWRAAIRTHLAPTA